MSNLIYKIRNKLIVLLAGKSTIVINAHFVNGGMVITTNHSLIKDTQLEVDNAQLYTAALTVK